MNNNLTAFLLSFLAGSSTLIGAFIILFIKNKTTKIINIALSFSSAVMFFLSILIPESISFFRKELFSVPSILICFIFVVIGLKIAKLIDKNLKEPKLNDSKLYRLGLLSMITIIIHNIPEGIATFVSTRESFSFGLSLSLAIAMHNIPEGISIALPIYYSTNKKSRAIFYTLISGLSELLGAFLTYLFLLPLVNNITLGILFSLIAGIMFYISIFELLKNALDYKNPRQTIISFLVGFVFIVLYILFF